MKKNDDVFRKMVLLVITAHRLILLVGLLLLVGVIIYKYA